METLRPVVTTGRDERPERELGEGASLCWVWEDGKGLGSGQGHALPSISETVCTTGWCLRVT